MVQGGSQRPVLNNNPLAKCRSQHNCPLRPVVDVWMVKLPLCYHNSNRVLTGKLWRPHLALSVALHVARQDILYLLYSHVIDIAEKDSCRVTFPVLSLNYNSFIPFIIHDSLIWEGHGLPVYIFQATTTEIAGPAPYTGINLIQNIASVTQCHRQSLPCDSATYYSSLM